MPRGLSSLVAAAMGGKIYVTGGENNVRNSENSVCMYDPQTNTWTQLASMSFARRCHASAAVDGKLYVFGGMDAEEELDSVEFYDPTSDRWTLVSSLPSACHSPAAVAL